jgi:hypothetical protein
MRYLSTLVSAFAFVESAVQTSTVIVLVLGMLYKVMELCTMDQVSIGSDRGSDV